MRKWQQEQMLNIIENIQKVHETIQNQIDSGLLDTAVNFLADCQESAIGIGNVIEQLEGQECPVIMHLEAYCEVLYTVSQQAEALGEGKATSMLDASLKQVEESVKTEVAVKKEIVFFPYKASMWDSLESIYLKAKQDENCDAYCVPIPYFDKKPDGTFSEMHYEGQEYPANIEIMDWESYDFENRKPDEIYIHNPYDECNYVTSVHPRFYAKNLCKYTEKLVYLPYFVLEEIEPDDQKKIDGIKHFCFLPGIIYAHQVIVQSEKMRQIYINEYLKAAKEIGLLVDRKQLEAKILGLGSPKFDKIRNTKREDLEIPPKWLKIIEKPDGSFKKIIFYNTSVTALLENDEKMLTKMEDVFEIFKERQEAVALLWRPHPLIKTTIQSMRPELWKRYEEIVEKYCTEGWGIYDDTADMDRAVILSDAYYGDHSSIVQLYQKTGKPVMVQNANERNAFFIPNDQMYREGNKYWFVGSQDNVLYSMEAETGLVRRIMVLPTESEDTYRINQRCVKYGDKVYCFPDRGKYIWIYDLTNSQLNKLEVYNPQEVRIGIYDFWMCDDILWCVSYGLSQIIEVSLAEEKIVGYFNAFADESENVGIKSEKVNDIIYCVSRKSNVITEFNVVTKDMVRKKVPMLAEEGMNTIVYDGKKFWLSGDDEKIYAWNGKQDADVIEDMLQVKNEADMPDFCNSVTLRNTVFFVPWNMKENKVVFIRTDNEKIEYLDSCLDEEGYTIEYIRDTKCLGIAGLKSGEIVEVDENGSYIGKQRMKPDINSFKLMLSEEMNKHGDNLMILLMCLGG